MKHISNFYLWNMDVIGPIYFNWNSIIFKHIFLPLLHFIKKKITKQMKIISRFVCVKYCPHSCNLFHLELHLYSIIHTSKQKSELYIYLYPYRCLKKRLDLRIAAFKANFALKWKYMRKYFSFMNFIYFGSKWPQFWSNFLDS